MCHHRLRSCQAPVTERQIELPPVAIIGVAVSQTHQSHPTPYTDEILHPLCARCREPMWLTRVEAEYPGHERRMFECQACGATMTEWTCMSRDKSSVRPSVGGDDAGVE